MNIKSIVKKAIKIITKDDNRKKLDSYFIRYRRLSFCGNKCLDETQYEAVITRWYHTIEKGLAYTNFRPGFGNNNINALLSTLENYNKEGYDTNSFFYRTALSTLKMYIEKNKKFGVENITLENRVASLPGTANDVGGIIKFTPLSKENLRELNYKEFVVNRHSMRHFSDEPVSLDDIIDSLDIAQHTPSACNRQGWQTIVISRKDILTSVLKNQNGNEGFGHEFDKLLLITSNIKAFNQERELFQPYIDGGMYAQSVLNALHFNRIASVPLSASLTTAQEINVRKLLDLDEAEVLIMFIGIGNYPQNDECQTTRSERHEARYKVI